MGEYEDATQSRTRKPTKDQEVLAARAVRRARDADLDIRAPALTGSADRAIESLREGGSARPARALDERDVVQGLVTQILAIPPNVIEAIRTGVDQAKERISVTETEKTSQLTPLILSAAAALCANLAGAALTWAGLTVGTDYVRTALREKVKSSLAAATTNTAALADHTDLRLAFTKAIDTRLLKAKTEFTNQLAKLHNSLVIRPVAELEALAAGGITDDLIQRIQDEAMTETLVAWTNFLARVTYGSGTWDFWERHGGKGAVKLQGATDPRQQDTESVGAGNIDANNQSDLLRLSQREAQPEHVGILEIYVHPTGQLVTIPGYGMRLDNVGPKVRAHLRTLGTVRDLRVNKIVRVVEVGRPGTPRMIRQSILITADGYVRRYNLGTSLQVHMPREPGAKADCFDQLIVGEQDEDCRIDTAGNERLVAEVAERAQSLPLSLMES